MSVQERAENARATREAREAVVHTAHARDPKAVDAALRRYLAAEQYARASHSRDRVEADREATGDENPT